MWASRWQSRLSLGRWTWSERTISDDCHAARSGDRPDSRQDERGSGALETAYSGPEHFRTRLLPTDMLELALLFFVIAIIAAAMGATGVAGVTMAIAKWLVLLFVVLAVVSLLL